MVKPMKRVKTVGPRIPIKRYCAKCELPKEICACAEAEAYDKANPLIED